MVDKYFNPLLKNQMNSIAPPEKLPQVLPSIGIISNVNIENTIKEEISILSNLGCKILVLKPQPIEKEFHSEIEQIEHRRFENLTRMTNNLKSRWRSNAGIK